MFANTDVVKDRYAEPQTNRLAAFLCIFAKHALHSRKYLEHSALLCSMDWICQVWPLRCSIS